LGIDIPDLAGVPQPYATHPDLAVVNRIHPFKDFGCTTCHGGQGYATRKDDAHGKMQHWEIPMTTRAKAKEYGFENTTELMEMYCNQCHRADTATLQMQNINVSKKLIVTKECRGCHNIDGKGGIVGPILTYEGSKYSGTFNFENVSGQKTVFQWNMEHFKDPARVTKDSAMKKFDVTNLEMRALTLLVMSWRKKVIPARFIPDPNRKIPKNILSPDYKKEEAAPKLDLGNKGIGPIAQMKLIPINQGRAEEGKKTFELKCSACHFIDTRKVGPALVKVTTRRSPEWIMNMILNTKEMVEKDPIASEMVTVYFTKMTFQDVTEAQARDILEYFRSIDAAKK
jgi:cytochrome c2